jgi:cell division inhibitor SepF
MSGLWTRTLVYLGLKEEPDDAVDWDVLEAADPEEAYVPRTSAVRRAAVQEPPMTRGAVERGRPASVSSGPAPAAESSNVRELRTPQVAAGDRTAVVQVRVFDDVEAVGSRHRQGRAVLFDVSACPKDVARRVVDFTSGLTYASRGRLVRVAPRVFLLLPDGFELPEEERRRLAGLGYDLGANVGGSNR